MTQPRAKRIHPVVKHRRPKRGERNDRPTPERLEWVRNEIRRRLGVPIPTPAAAADDPTQA